MSFEPDLPEEARGDLFDIVTAGQPTTEDVDDTTAFYYNVRDPDMEKTVVEETTTEETTTEETTDDPKTSSDLENTLFDTVTDFKALMTEEPAQTTSTVLPSVPSTPSETSTSVIYSSGSDGVLSFGVPDGSGDIQATTQAEGSTDVPLTQASDRLVSGMTNETEMEVFTFIPDPNPEETSTQAQAKDLEGSASGEDGISEQEQDPTKPFTTTSKTPPTHSTLHSPTPPPGAVDNPTAYAGAERGSGGEQLSGEEEGQSSGEQVRLSDPDGDVTGTVLPDVSGDQTVATTPTDNKNGSTTRPTTSNQQDKLTIYTSVHQTKPLPSTWSSTKSPEDTPALLPLIRSATKSPEDQPELLSSTRSTMKGLDNQPALLPLIKSTMKSPEVTPEPLLSIRLSPQSSNHGTQLPPTISSSSPTSSTHTPHQTTHSTTSPVYTFDHSPHSIPRWALIPDPAATSLLEEFVNYDNEIAPILQESYPQVPVKMRTTEQPETDTAPASYEETPTVNIRGIVGFSYSLRHVSDV